MTSPTAADEVEAASGEIDLPHAVNQVIRRHAGYAAIGGVVPVPLFEIVAATSIQLRMVARLCDLYEVPFSGQAVKAAIGSLMGAVLPVSSIGYSALSLSRTVPVVGPVLGIATIPALAAASTWAVGRIFAWHFAAGGTLDDLDVSEKTEAFKREFEKGRRRASELARGVRGSGVSGEGAGRQDA